MRNTHGDERSETTYMSQAKNGHKIYRIYLILTDAARPGYVSKRSVGQDKKRY